MLTIIGGTNAAYMPSAPFMPAPAQPRRATRRRLAAAVRAAATNWDEPFEVTVQRPLGIQLAEQAGVGVVVSDVSVGSNAYGAGISVGDIVLATSATMGSGMWPKKTVDGVEAAIQTRLDGKVRLPVTNRIPVLVEPVRVLVLCDTLRDTYDRRRSGSVLHSTACVCTCSGLETVATFEVAACTALDCAATQLLTAACTLDYRLRLCR